jgi:hypothetical protein
MMQIVEIGNLRMVHGSGLPLVGIVIECTKEEATECGTLLYKSIDVMLPDDKPSKGDELWREFAVRIADVDKRLRKEKPSKRFTRDEVLAMLDEIDPEGAENA